MSLVATSDPILAVVKPYQGLYNSDHWLWGNLVTEAGNLDLNLVLAYL